MQIDCVRACASPAYRLEYQVWRWLARPKESLIALSRSTSQFSGRGNAIRELPLVTWVGQSERSKLAPGLCLIRHASEAGRVA